jgi:hypothetical protein
MPLTLALVALGAISGILIATVGASDPPARLAADEAGGGGVAAACIEGTVDCNDTVGLGDGDIAPLCVEGTVDCDDMIEPGDGSMNMCIEGAEDCNDIVIDEPPPDAGSSGGPTNLVGVEFTADYTQADIDLVTDIIVQFDHDAEVLVLERFPPAASAVVHHDSPNYCDELVAQLEAVHGVDSASCAPYTPSTGDPDEPVSNKPDETSGGGGSDGVVCAPDTGECTSPPSGPSQP